MRQVLQSVTDCGYKMRQVLQSMTVITKWDVTPWGCISLIGTNQWCLSVLQKYFFLSNFPLRFCFKMDIFRSLPNVGKLRKTRLLDQIKIRAKDEGKYKRGRSQLRWRVKNLPSWQKNIFTTWVNYENWIPSGFWSKWFNKNRY